MQATTCLLVAQRRDKLHHDPKAAQSGSNVGGLLRVVTGHRCRHTNIDGPVLTITGRSDVLGGERYKTRSANDDGDEQYGAAISFPRWVNFSGWFRPSCIGRPDVTPNRIGIAPHRSTGKARIPVPGQTILNLSGTYGSLQALAWRRLSKCRPGCSTPMGRHRRYRAKPDGPFPLASLVAL